jgi:hypothetical protein
VKIVAADIASATGLAVDGGDGRPRGLTFRVPCGGEDLGRAGLAFSEWLYGVVAIEKPDLLAIEAPVLGNAGGRVFTSEILIGLAFMAAVVAKSRGIRFERAHVQTVRRHLLGQGRPDNPKRAVLARCRLLGWAPANDNEADAMAVWAWAKARHDRTFRYESATELFGRAL